MIFLTDRLYLRPWREDDAEALFACAADPSVGMACGWKPHDNIDESRQVILNILAVEETYAICLKTDCLPIGCISLMSGQQEGVRYPDGACELGYWVGKPYWGQQLVPEAAVAILRHAFEDLRMNAIWCAYYEGNEKSKRVQEKLGFVYHHTNAEEAVPQLQEVRTAHYSIMTKERWQSVNDEAYRQCFIYRRAKMKTAIVYYSLSGNTEMIAESLVARLGADTLRLVPSKAYPTGGFKKFFWGGKSAVMGEAPALEPYAFDAADYDRIIFGTPVWAGTFTPPLRTFLQENKDALAGKRFAVFACQSGSGAEKAIEKMKKELGVASFDATLILIDPKDQENAENETALDAFCRELTE